jgi:ribosomal protein L11 methyltransferase
MMLQLFPEGFEEQELVDGVELAAYTDWRGEERLWQVFGAARADPIDTGWAERWRRFHRAVRVGPLWIGPPWLEPDQDAIAVVIDPGRAFGTGAHPTTRLCLELLLDLERTSVLDIGCGSGVVAIAASKLGFGPVAAVDVDPVAVEATQVNAAANDVSLATQVLDALDPAVSLPAADVVVANISHETVAAIAPRTDSSVFVSSGYLEREQPSIRGLRPERRRTADGWAADLFARA